MEQQATVHRIAAMAYAAQQANSTGPLSVGEAVAVALVLNRFDWLQKLGFTMIEAIHRVGPDWMNLLPDVVSQVHAKVRADEYAATELAQTEQFITLQRHILGTENLELNAHLVTHSLAPGYRDLRIKVSMRPQDAPETSAMTAWLYFNAEASTELLDHLWETHELAWTGEERSPLDFKQHQRAPRCFFKTAPRPQLNK